MGAYSPAPVVTDEVYAKAMNEIILPTVQGMEKDGIPFTGFLYAGLMIGKDREGALTVKTLEFNCRFGDPETQPIMSRMKSSFVDLVDAGIEGRLDQVQVEWDSRFALGVVCAARGYPDSPEKGAVITQLPANTDDLKVFHAGTKAVDGQATVSGGRVLCVVGLGEDVRAAAAQAYAGVEQVKFEGMQFRRDIGYRAMK